MAKTSRLVTSRNTRNSKLPSSSSAGVREGILIWVSFLSGQYFFIPKLVAMACFLPNLYSSVKFS